MQADRWLDAVYHVALGLLALLVAFVCLEATFIVMAAEDWLTAACGAAGAWVVAMLWYAHLLKREQA